MKNWRDEPMTEKQSEYINQIICEIGGKFKGATKGEAADFIKEHRKEYLDSIHQNNFEFEAAQEIIDGGRDW